MAEKKEMGERLAELCAGSFKEKNYLLLLDDFEQNQEGAEQGEPGLLTAEAALPIDERVYGNEHPDVARDLNNLGTAYFALGDKKRARPYFEQAYHIFKKLFGDEHPQTITVKEWLEKWWIGEWYGRVCLPDARWWVSAPALL